MAVPEPARHDLYNGLVDLLGVERAGTLMTYLASIDPSHLATKTDIAVLRSDLVSRIDRLEGGLVEFKIETRGAMDAVNTRLDRLFVSLLAGLFVVVAAMVGVLVTLGQ